MPSDYYARPGGHTPPLQISSFEVFGELESTANLNMISFVIGTGVASLAAGSWSKLSDGPWTAREGLMAVSNGESIFMSGGRYSNICSLAAHLHYYLADGYAPRTQDGLGFGSDVWKTENGTHWTEVQQTAFPKRVYHQ